VTRTDITVPQKIGIWAGALLVASLFVHGLELATPGLLDRSGRLKASDYSRLYVTGAIAHEGRWGMLFDANTHLAVAKARVHPQLEMEGLHPNYGPTAAWLLGPFSRLSFLRSWLAFTIVSTTLYLLAILALVDTTPALARWRWLVLLGALASPALFTAMRYGQLSAVTAAVFAVTAAAGRRGRPWIAGFCLGLASYKPNLIVPALTIWLLAREWRLLGGLVGGAIAHVGVGVIVAGPSVTVEWIHVLATLARDPNLIQGFPGEVHSLRGFWRLLGLQGAALGALALLTSLAVVVVAVRIWRAGSTSARWAGLTAATILVSPHLLTYDLLLLSGALVLILETALEQGQRLRLTCLPVLLCLGLYFAPLISPLPAGEMRFQLSTLAMLGLLGWLAGTTSAASSGAASSNPIISS